MNKPHDKQEKKNPNKQAAELQKRKPAKKKSPHSEADLLRIIHALEIQLMELKAENDDLRQAEQSGRLNKKYLEVGREVLQILNEFGDPRDSMQRVLDVLKQRTGFDAVGIRLQKDDDFPYYAQNGFSGDFLMTENTLVERSGDGQLCHDQDGNVSLECTCGLVLSGRTDPGNPLFTAGGSAWTNDSLPFLDVLPHDDPRYHPRNKCIHQGYSSVALVPMRNKEKIIGLIQLNDHRKDCFDLQTIELLEGIASHIGEALMRKQAEDDLMESRELLSLYIIHSPIYSYIKEVTSTVSCVLKASENFQDMIGIPGSEMVGKNMYELFPAELAAKISSDDWTIVSEGKMLEMEEDLNGRAYYSVKYPIFQGGKNLLAGYSIDITDRKQAEHEIRLRGEILENMAEGVLLIRAEDWIIVYANPTVEQLFGYGHKELVGKNISIIDSPAEGNHEAKIHEIIKHLIDEGFWKGEVQNVKKDGTLSWSSAIVSAFTHPQYGKVWLSILQDITTRKLAEQAMRISDEKYRTMLNSSPDGILLINMKGIITEVSEIGMELFGVDTKDDLAGKDLFQFVPPDDQNTLKEIIDKTMNEGLAQNIGLKFRKKNQSVFAGETSATLIQGPDGVPVAFMIIIRDISQRKKLETKQGHADRMANLGEMASGIAHEINQPLNIISMVLDKILFESDKTESIDIDFLRNKSDKIFENITRIRNIIDQIRAFSRSHDDYVLSAFNINTSIGNATSMIAEQFKHLGIKLVLQLEKKIPPLFGNSIKFEQVIVNLLLNAKDAVIDNRTKREGNVSMVVGIRSYLEHHHIIVEVTDNGIGISAIDLNNIMLPFYTTKDEGKGTGLGLSICYQIIKEMNGSIEISSDPVHGTKIKLVMDIENLSNNVSTR
jgi:PAS domain S-box-containing protein